jgi:hypothetical protein
MSWNAEKRKKLSKWEKRLIEDVDVLNETFMNSPQNQSIDEKLQKVH